MEKKKLLGRVIVLSVAYTVTVVFVLHFLQPDKNPAVNAISEYVSGRGGPIMSSVFFVQSIGSFALAFLVFGLSPRGGKVIFGSILFMLAALGDVLAGLFPADPITTESMTEAGMIHALGGITRFLSLAIALPLMTAVLKKHDYWQKRSRVLQVLAVAFILAFIVTMFFLTPAGLFGFGQRVFILIALLWMIVVGFPMTRI